MRRLELAIHCAVGGEHEMFLREKLLAVADRVDPRPDALSLAVVDADAMAGLHERFLNIGGPTDVLTFELDHDADGRVTEGEVVICLDVAAEQAAERGHAVERELLLYAVHGLLHLSGHDDLTPIEHDAMHAREDELLEAVGVGRTFTCGDAAP